MTTPPDDLTTILEDLAAGRIDSAEAARRIDAQDSGPSAAPRAPAPEAPATQESDAWAAATDRPQQATHRTERVGPMPATDGDEQIHSGQEEPAVVGRRPGGGVARISVRAVGRRVRVVGVPAVATAAVDGPHVIRRRDDVLEISSDGEIGASIDGFQLLRGAPRSLEDVRALGLGKELLVRVNPALPVDVEVTAGSLHTERVPVLGRVRVTAGGAKLLDVEEVADALIQAGQATVRGTLREGRSRLRAESGSLVVQLSDRSDVTVVTETQLGKVSWSGQHSGAGDEVTMGSGRARLDVGVVMGYASVQAGAVAAEQR